jgi:hypothetical protein
LVNQSDTTERKAFWSERLEALSDVLKTSAPPRAASKARPARRVRKSRR